MIEDLTVTSVRVAGIVVGTIVLDLVLESAIRRFFRRNDRGDQERLASLRHVARTALRVVLTLIASLLILDTVGIDIGALIAAVGVIGLAISFGAQPLIRDVIAYVSFVFADNFRIGEEVTMDGKRGELVKFELRSVVLKVDGDGGQWLAYVPYSKIGTIENFDRALADA